MLSTLGSYTMGLGLAILLNNPKMKESKVYKTILIVPWALPSTIAILAWQGLLNEQYGGINNLLHALGITANIPWMTDALWARIGIIIVNVWLGFPYMMNVCLGGLQAIPNDYYEAAKIDGANGWKTFWSITVPLLKPTIIMTFIMSINGTLQLFDESVNLTHGGPANATITMSHHIYNTVFLRSPNFGYGAAMSFFVFVLVAILAFINMKVGDTRD